MAKTTHKNETPHKRDIKKTAIRVICLVLALSMVIGTVYMLFMHLVNAFS